MAEDPDKPKKGLSDPSAAYRHKGEVDGFENYVPEDEWDAYLWRNRHAIRASCDKAEEDYARGHYYTIEEVMNRVRATIERVAKKP